MSQPRGAERVLRIAPGAMGQLKTSADGVPQYRLQPEVLGTQYCRLKPVLRNAVSRRFEAPTRFNVLCVESSE